MVRTRVLLIAHIHSLQDDNPDTALTVAKSVLKAYCDSTTVHGFAYLNSYGWCERMFWVAVIATGLAVASVVINQAFA